MVLNVNYESLIMDLMASGWLKKIRIFINGLIFVQNGCIGKVFSNKRKDEIETEENYFFDLERISFKGKRPGVQLKSITGEKMQLQIVQLEPNFESDHSHVQKK